MVPIGSEVRLFFFFFPSSLIAACSFWGHFGRVFEDFTPAVGCVRKLLLRGMAWHGMARAGQIRKGARGRWTVLVLFGTTTIDLCIVWQIWVFCSLVFSWTAGWIEVRG
ncbi:hypothetical protein HOY82DRAFT_53775 [Tuber indicum]|nr:hypothetical protein HOY82DRAFT_53775 [Tuber indicum]